MKGTVITLCRVILETVSVIQVRGQQTVAHWPLSVAADFFVCKVLSELGHTVCCFPAATAEQVSCGHVWPMKHK